MIRVSGKAAVYGELWFDETLPRDPGVDIVHYRHRAEPPPGAPCTSSLSLVIDLSADSEVILRGFKAICRQEIRRADTKDGLQCEFLTTPGNRLSAFFEFFDLFARQKSLPPCNRAWLSAADRAGRLTLSSASVKGGDPVVWHAYIHWGHTVLLHHSVSCFREKDNGTRALTGRANRWLHWQDMLMFRKMGVKCYDLGGLFQDESGPEQEGINRFKKGFGGRVERHFEWTAPVTLKGRVYLRLREAWYRWHFFQARAAASALPCGKATSW
jgi:hypothetical protein